MKKTIPLLLAGLLPLLACAEQPSLPTSREFGPNPTLPEPQKSLIPTVNIAPAKPFAEGQTPIATKGFQVKAFAQGLEHPRWLYVLPNGDVLVAETDAPPKPDDAKGITGWIMKKTMKKAGSGTSPSANRISLYRDTDGDGVADQHSVLIDGLNSPFGMTLVGHTLYIADTDALLSVPYHDGEIKITEKPTKVADLPAGTINHHWTKNVIASADGKHLFVTVGSNSNAGDNGLDKETDRARIIEIDPANGEIKPFATGLRNPNGLAFNPQSGMLWTAVNERDELGDHLVPDYMTSVKEGAFYGWPYSYYGQHVDDRVKPQDPDKVATAIAPDYALGDHTASLGLAFYTASLFPQHYKNGAFVGQHGSWNRKPKAGYKVIFVPFTNGKPDGAPEDFLTGFLDGDENAMGRPVGVVIDKQGAVLVADDVGNRIWRVSPVK